MNPTNYLRFVEKDNRKVLQQWWHSTEFDVCIANSPSGSAGQWVDVGLVKESE